MNYLAHLIFAEPTPESRVGNLMGDFIRGRIPTEWPEPVRQGIWLHRRIDAWTDQHEVFVTSKGRISPARRRVAGIILDIAYDHFLSRHWQLFSPTPRSLFIAGVYRDLENYRGVLPERMQRPVQLMCQQDWLSCYHSIDETGRVLDRVARRFSRPTRLAGAGEEIRRAYPQLEADFLRFFPALIDYVRGLPGVSGAAERLLLPGETGRC